MKESAHNPVKGGISFRDVLESDDWRSFRGELPLAIGRCEDGRFLIRDLARLPHLLLAGTTGSGKSVCLRTLICGLVDQCLLEDLKLMLVDLKNIEFPYCRDFPQLLLPVVCEAEKAYFAFRAMNVEIERRQKTLSQAGVRDLAEFKCAKPETPLARIVVVIDDLGDLMSHLDSCESDDLLSIMRQGPRVGIHVVCATSQMSTPVQGVIDAADQIGRMAFRTVSTSGSEDILGVAGAETLPGFGTALFKDEDGALCPVTVVAVEDGEIQDLVHTSLVENGVDPVRKDRDASVQCEDLDSAIRCIYTTRRASVSHFQRRLGWGYNHAVDVLETLSRLGIVSPPQGPGPRTILMNQAEAEVLLCFLSPRRFEQR